LRALSLQLIGCRRGEAVASVFARDGAEMSTQIELNDEDVALLLTLLRTTAQPMTTQQLIDALRQQESPSLSEDRAE
jgi:hypothetical protein